MLPWVLTFLPNYSSLCLLLSYKLEDMTRSTIIACVVITLRKKEKATSLSRRICKAKSEQTNNLFIENSRNFYCRSSFSSLRSKMIPMHRQGPATNSGVYPEPCHRLSACWTLFLGNFGTNPNTFNSHNRASAEHHPGQNARHAK